MLKGRRSRLMIVAIVVVVVVAGYYGIRAMAGSNNGALKASGTIETTTVNVSPELAGKVQSVAVEEGQSVTQGQVLFRLDDTLLQAQRAAAAAGLQAAQSAAQTAQAAYASAQAQYNITLTAARAQARPTRISDWAGKTPDYFNQPKWYFTQEEQRAAAQVEVQAAQAGVTAAEANLATVVGDLQNAEFVAAEMRLSNARLAYVVALQVQAEGQAVGQGTAPDQLDLGALGISIPCKQTPVGQFCAPGYGIRIRIAKNLPNQAPLYDASQTAYDAANRELSDAQVAYNHLLTSKSAQAVLKARATLAVANERAQVAQDRLSGLQTGDQSPQVALAAAGLQQAQNAAQSAQAAVGQASANLGLLDAQVAKLEVKAPMGGVILTRNIEPGEYVAPGGAALTMGQLADLTITVYVPEDRYGEIHLGQAASVSVDSFAGQVFAARVSNISDQAEFTPRNVQTVEGRSSTVYAIKLSVQDPTGKLKPGMPADVTFGQ
jgi:HlyD family secretion protein